MAAEATNEEQDECVKRTIAASTLENEAIDLDRTGKPQEAIAKYEAAEREFAAAIAAALPGHSEDHPKLVQHRREVLERIDYLKGLKGATPTISVEQQIKAVQLGMAAQSSVDPAVPLAQVIYKTDEPAPPASPSAPEEQGMGGAPANDDDVTITGMSKVEPGSVKIPRLMKEARKARKTYAKIEASAEKVYSIYQTSSVIRYELTEALMDATVIERDVAVEYAKMDASTEKDQTTTVIRYELTEALMQATIMERETAVEYKKISDEEDKAGDALSDKEDELDEALNWNNAMGGPPAHKRRRS